MTNIYNDDLALFSKYPLNDLMTRKFVFICLYSNAYSKPCLSSEIDCFCKHGWLLLAVKCFHKTLCLRYLTEYSKENKNQSNVQIAQPARDVPGTSPEGPLKFLTSRTSRGPSGDSQGTNKKINNLMKKMFFRCNSSCFTHLLLFLLEKQIRKSSKWGRPRDVYGTHLRDVLWTR